MTIQDLSLDVRITLKNVISMTYNCTDEHTEVLSDFHDKLKQLVGEFKAKMPQEDGVLLRPHLKKKAKLAQKKKVALSLASLPKPSTRGRKRQNAAYRHRVGRKADALRKVLSH